jgi:preprotein translocase subunit SecE
MASQDDNEDRSNDSEEQDQATEETSATPAAPEHAEGGAITPTQLGAAKYVHAAFFAAGILAAYISGKILLVIWNRLSEWEAAVRVLPQLLRFPEDERDGLSMIVGAVIGLLCVIQSYRKEGVRRWADEVASELSKVVWPNKELVSNGTIVVIVASTVGTVYVALLDQFWQFLTQLIYRS